MKFRMLNADEIECRVSTISEKGLSLLLYKTARTDANLLDETVGPENWENDFKTVDGVLYGGIGVYDRNTGNTMWKWDAGTESNTEAEKGRASDAFKRAGFKWGIGRELYTAPFIWIPKEGCEIVQGRNGKPTCYDEFRVVEIGYSETGEINKLTISNEKKGIDVFVFPKYARKPPQKAFQGPDVKSPGESRESSQKPVKEPVEGPDGYFYCENCGKQLVGTVLSNGKRITHDEVARRTIKKYGKQLCPDCCKDAMPIS